MIHLTAPCVSSVELLQKWQSLGENSSMHDSSELLVSSEQQGIQDQ